MHLIQLSDVQHSEESMTQAVMQITQMLGLYHAELARILQLQCVDIGEMSMARARLSRQTNAWLQAEHFVLLFERLFQKFQGEEAQMCNWLRRTDADLHGIPLYLMVDDGRLKDVLRMLEE